MINTDPFYIYATLAEAQQINKSAVFIYHLD